MVKGFTDREVKNNEPTKNFKKENKTMNENMQSLTKAQIMSRAASSMLAQANASGDVFLRLIN